MFEQLRQTRFPVRCPLNKVKGSFKKEIARTCEVDTIDIECFHSRGQHLCKFIETKESVCIRKEFNSQRIGSGHQHGCRFIVLGHQYGRLDVI